MIFRELSRKKNQLSIEECRKILLQEKRGVLSVFGDGDYPYGMPMNHYFDGESGAIFFHCGQKGHRLDALRRSDKASFCVYDQGYQKAGEWALNIKSVIAFGRVEIMDDPALIKEISEKLSRKFTQDEAYIQKEIQDHAKNTLLLKLTPEHLCGKLVNES